MKRDYTAETLPPDQFAPVAPDGAPTAPNAGPSVQSAKSPAKLHTMMETCALCGIPYETLKFYCNKGLVPNVKRDANNRRVFDDRDVAWIQSMGCLKRCGLSLAEIQDYLELCLQGPSSIPARKELLAAKRVLLVEKLAEVQASIDFLDWKQGYYDDVLAGRTEYTSNALPCG